MTLEEKNTELQNSLQIEKDRVELFKQRWIDQINLNEAIQLQLVAYERQISCQQLLSTPLLEQTMETK